jgi:diamine N-acetyltransferase
MEVSLRPLQESDARTSAHWRNNPAIWAHTGSRPDHHITLEEELAWIRRVTADPTGRRFAILADGVYVGNTYLTDIQDGVGEYHIFIGDQEYWGKGIAKQATRQVITYGKDHLKLRRIELRVKPANQAALAIYTSLGFQAVGEDNGFSHMVLIFPRKSGRG